MSRTDDIHRLVMERAGKPPAARTAPRPGTMPYVAEAGQKMAEGLRDENQRLKAERSEGRVVLLLDPKTVRASKFSNRDPRSLEAADPDFADLMHDIEDHGQLIPISVRPLQGAAPYEWEIIFGHRRHAACLLLDAQHPEGFAVRALVDVKAEDDRHALRAWYGENARRKGVSAYEYAVRYREALDAGVFKEQDDLAASVGVSKGLISQYLAVLEFPPEIFEAYGSRHAISQRHIPDIAKALRENRTHVLALAKRLMALEPRLPPPAVWKTLTTPPSTPGTGDKTRVSIERKGRVAVTVSDRSGKLSLKLGAVLLKRDGAEQRFSAHMKAAAERFVDEELGDD